MGAATSPTGTVLKNARHELFAQLIVSGLPQAAAHVQAGFAGSDKAHEANASRLIRADKVAARIAELRAPVVQALATRADGVSVTAARIAEEAARIAFGDIRDLVWWDGESVTLHDSSTLTAAQAAMVKEVRVQKTTTRLKDGTESEQETREVKVWDKLSALSLLAKMFPEFSEKHEIDARVGVMLVRQTRSLTSGR